MSADAELAEAVESIRAEYGRRDNALQCRGVYSLQNPAHAYLVFERERAIIASLTRHLSVPLGEASVLDVGCSAAVSLALLAISGARADRLHGVDIVAARIDAGRATFPAFDLRVSDGVDLDNADATFDLVQQITVLSSVPSLDLRRHLAAEMVRVLKPGGVLLSYDVAHVGVLPRAINRVLRAFPSRGKPAATSSVNAAAEAVVLRNPSELDPEHLRELFEGTTQLELRRLSLYRPLAERLARHDALLATASAFAPLRTTLLYVGRKPAG